MKPMTHYQKALVVNCMLLTGLLLGCAGSTVGTQKDQPTARKLGDNIKIEENLPGIAISDTEKETYEIVETPFGLVKRPKGDKRAVAGHGFPGAPATGSVQQAPTAPAVNPFPGKPTRAQKDVAKKKIKSDRRPPGDVFLNFDNADLYEVIRTFAELLDLNTIIDKNVKGNITIQTVRGLHREDLWPVFFQVLEINGLTAVEEDHLFRIVQNKETSRLPLSYHMGRQGPQTHPSERISIQIVPLDFIKAKEMTTLIKPFVSAEGTIITHDKSNTLIIVDKGSSIVKALHMIEVFDIDMFQQVRHRFFTFQFNQAEDIANVIKEILDGYGEGMMEDYKLITIERLNTMLVISGSERVMDIIGNFIERLDVPSDDVEPRIYIYHVQNGQATDLGSLLGQIFTKSGDKEEKYLKTEPAGGSAENAASSGNPLMKEAYSTPEKEPAAPSAESSPATTRPPGADGGAGGTGASTLRGELKITTDETRNALIIEAVPADYRVVKEVLTQLDVMPRQVLIEVIIAEVALDDKTELGVEWSYLTRNLGLETAVQIGSSGLSYAINFSDKWLMALNALATDNKLKIISAPSVMASDNKPATINVSTEIPVASAEYEFNTVGGVTSTTIQYRNTGIILTVTPTINERGLVSMEISQEVSNQSAGVQVGDKVYPSFRNRSVKTTLTVGHQQTIVMGGLIEENEEANESGVPFLNKIPLLKYLVGSHAKSASRTELVLSITPHVIVDLNDVEVITKDFRKKISL